MPFGSSQWMYASGADFYNGVATQSLRFDNASSSHLKGTLSASFNTYTFSAWIKRSTITSSYFQYIFSSGSGGLAIGSTASHTDKFYVYDGTTAQPTDAVYRDPSGWYHVVLSSNSGTGVLYVNGVSVKTGINCASTSTTTNYTMIGYYPVTASALYFDGYMADVNFIDGTAIGDSDADGYLDEFGQLKFGTWIPKAYTGSYGTNGFRLEFKQTGTGTASSSTIGADTSGNANHFSSSGIVASDCDMPDSPELNWSTMNPLINGYGTNITMSEGNLAGTGTSGQYNNTLGTILMTSGKWYWEISSADFNNYDMLGIAIETAEQTSDSTPYGQTGVIAYATQGAVYNESASGTGSYTSFQASEIIGIAVDLDASPRTFKFYNNNTLQGTINLSSNFDDVGILPFFCIGNTDTIKVNFGQDSSFAGLKTAQGNTDDNDLGDFYYSPPSGYLALCSANLPEPTISPNADTQADDHFNVEFYNGNNDATRTFDIGFISDFAWFASFTGSYGHQLYDSTRGVQKYLRSHSNIAEVTNTDGLLDFDDNGLLKIGTDAFLNESGTDMMIWNWKANGGVTSTIAVDTYSAGVPSVASTVQANTDAGFSIVTFPANGTNGTVVGHGLGTAPKMIITKQRPAVSSWYIYHDAIGKNKWVRFNNPNTEGERDTAGSTLWGNVNPDGNTFTIGNSDTGYNNGGANDVVAYCFSEVDGYSKFGSFIGNGNATDGTFIYLGFRPKFFMMFLVSSASLHLWLCYNSTKDTANPLASEIYFSGDSLDGETSFSLGDFVSNGVKLRNNNAVRNLSGGEFIYMAFAETPFRYANAR